MSDYQPKNPRTIAHLKSVRERMPSVTTDNWTESSFADRLEHELNLAATAIVELTDRQLPLAQFQREVSAWAAKTFPGQTPASKAAHLHDEAGELKDAPGDGEEMADVFILLLNLAEMAGLDLMEEARKKMAINRNRTWGPPDERGVCNHVN